MEEKNKTPETESKPNPLDILFNEQIEQKQQLQNQHQFDRDEWLEQCLIEQDTYLDWAYAIREYEYEGIHQREKPYGSGWIF